MNILNNILDKASRESIRLLNTFLSQVAIWHWGWFFLAGCVAVTLFFVGGRLRRFNHPDLPFLSPLIRSTLGRGLMWSGAVALIVFVTAVAAGLSLLLVASIGQALPRALDPWVTFWHYLLLIWPWVTAPLFGVVSGCAVGLATSIYLVYRSVPLLERGEGLRDVRLMQRLFRRMSQFKPLDFIDLTKGVFVGLEDGHRPLHIPFRQLHETHMQILGASGGGKGIALGVLGYQFVLAGQSTIVFDPKGDRRLPLVLAEAAHKVKARFHYLDLNPGTGPQFNLLAGAKSHEIEELLVGGLGLEPSGGEGNYYRGLDQDAAQQVAGRAGSRDQASMSDLLEIALSDEAFEKADNFLRRLRQVCDLPAIQTSHDIDFFGILERGEVLYIRGSTDNHRVKALQTMLLIRLLQVCRRRSNTDPPCRFNIDPGRVVAF